MPEYESEPSAPSAKRLYLVVGAAALALYLATMAPGVLWQDSGLAQVRVLRLDLVGDGGLALSHPLYYLVALAFQSLPFDESAFKTNLVSPVFAAITVANLFALLLGLTGCRRAAAAGAASLAVAHTFWQHAALAEVYTLSTALLTTELLCLRQFDRTGRERWLVLLFLLNGLGVSNHMLASLSGACYGGLLIWRAREGRLRARVLPLSALAWLAGASIYLGLIAARIAAGDGVEATLRSALFGKHWADGVLNLVPSGRQLVNSALVLAMNFPTPVALLVVPGLAALRPKRGGSTSAMLVALLTIHLVWAVRYDVADQYTFFIPAVVLLAVVIGLGAHRFLRARPGPWAAALLAGSIMPAGLYVAAPTFARRINVDLGLTRQVPYREEYSYFLHPWKTGYEGARRFAEEAHATLPADAVLWADSTTAPPLHYLELTGRWTKAIRVYPPIEMNEATKAGFTEPALEADLAAGRVYVVTPQPGYCPAWMLGRCDFEPAGVLFRASPKRSPERGAGGRGP